MKLPTSLWLWICPLWPHHEDTYRPFGALGVDRAAMSWRSASQTEPSSGSETGAAAISRATSSAGRMRPGEPEPGQQGSEPLHDRIADPPPVRIHQLGIGPDFRRGVTHRDEVLVLDVDAIDVLPHG